MSDVFNALSSQTRRQILSLLKSRDMTAGEIADELSVGKSTLSGHFNVLKATDLVVTERQGTTINYSLNTSVVEDLLAAVVGLLSSQEEKETKGENDPAI
ncbi:MAG: winged helix-turn-helix transcriptional regulator [Kordiimonadaceae bacterium]|nr:winged helix-turn-helix transcriptional regulator [Kordiimonadaceae bacterium]MBO6567239.1 winged helix-turn-helix transcriptional regulator [Kordiimonadaceae bacterium]MBO6963547.1 winged helix-turn-helix transcriptional regulator [Kordiimonadaceae bacterium]